MQSEIAVEETLRTILKRIEVKLKHHHAHPQAQEALKELGRFTLLQFEWVTPPWAQHFEELFK